MRYEYTTGEARQGECFTEVSNKLGSEGWELVQVERVNGIIQGIYKREVLPPLLVKDISGNANKVKPGSVTYVPK